MQHLPLCIIYVNYNNWEDLKESIQNLYLTEGVPFSIYVADNDSTDDSVNELHNWLQSERKQVKKWTENSFQQADINNISEINLISLKKNYGFGKANNIILQKFLDEEMNVLLLNPDMILRKDCLHYLITAASADKKAIFGASVFNFKHQNQLMYNGGVNINKFSGTVIFNKFNKAPEVISGGCLFTNSTILKKVGLFPENYFLYWEDAVLCKKVKAAGYKIKTAKGAVAFDKGSTTIGKGFLAEYYYTLNALRYIKNHHWFYLPFVLIFNIFRGIKRIIFLKFDKLKAVCLATIHFLKGKEYDISEINNYK